MLSKLFSVRGGLCLLLFCCMLPTANIAIAAKPFELKEGDRLLLIGATHIEQAQYYGDIELLLTTKYPQKHLVFRNLGWAGDNVFGEARAMFGKNKVGFAHLIKHVQLVKPTVIFLQYGTNESQQGKTGLAAFLKQYDYLIDQLSKEATRIVLLSPIIHEAAASPLPSQAVRQVNSQLELYSHSVKELAKKRHLRFVDLFHAKILRDADNRITSNGVLLTPQGYRQLAIVIADSLGISLSDKVVENKELREAILKKNAFFFNRTRPQNEVYLRGFRKHEQGNNAKEIFQLDALIEKMDQKISSIKKKAK